MSTVKQILAEFTPKLEAAIRAEALETVKATLSKSSFAPKPIVVRAARAKKPAAVGVKRTPEDIAQVAGKLLGVITNNGAEGANAEGLKATLGVDLKTIQLPLKQLLAEKRIKKTGHKRSTRYFAKA